MHLSWQEHRTGTPPTLVQFPVQRGIFLPEINTQCRLSYGVRTSPPAIACIYISVYVKDLVVHVRVRWIMETLKHPACTLGWVARLCRSWLSPGKVTRISDGKNPIGTIRLKEVVLLFFSHKKKTRHHQQLRHNTSCFHFQCLTSAILVDQQWALWSRLH